MKRLFGLTVSLVLFFGILSAQSPQGFKYQALARNTSNQPYANTALQVRLSLVPAGGSAVYVESHNVTTSDLGVFNLNVGQGTAVSGSFAGINWASAAHFVQVEISLDNGFSFTNLGTSSLLSVPYALYANQAGSDGDNSPTNEIQDLSLSGTTLSLTNDATPVDLSGIGSKWINSANGGIYRPSGSIGLGVSDPQAQLHIGYGGSMLFNPVPSAVTQNGGRIDMIDEDFRITNIQVGEVILYSANGPSFLSVGNNRHTGINTLNPTANLHLHQDCCSQTSLRFTGNNTGETVNDGSYIGIDNSTSNSKMYISNLEGGNIGFSVGATESFILGSTEVNVKSSRLLMSFTTVPSTNIGVIQRTSNGMEVGGTLTSNIDNGDNLGLSTRRWIAVYATNGTINTSDAREKQAIQPLGYGLAQVMQMKPVSFEWKTMPEQGRKIGFLAQDLQTLLPEVVADKEIRRDENNQIISKPAERLGVYYSDIIPVLTKAIQEQQALIEALQQQVAELERKAQK